MRAFIRAHETDVGAGAAFDPETINILVAAFDDACRSVTTSGIADFE